MNLFTEISPIKDYTVNNWEIKNDNSFPSTKNKDISEACFVICKNCFWCASLLSPKEQYPECPGCHEPNLDFMLIEGDENYRSHQKPAHLVEMEFLG